jgi:CheY-like chemotaxis protein
MSGGAGPELTAGHQGFITPAAQVAPQRRVTVRGVIRSHQRLAIGGVPACRYALADGTGEVGLLFLGRSQIAGLDRGRSCTASGTSGQRQGTVVLWNPRYCLGPASDDGAADRGPLGLAVRPAQREGRACPSASAGERTPAGVSVLVADDDPAIRRILQLTLKASGFEVDVAATAAAAIEAARNCPDLIILDIGLPDICGLTAIARIREFCDAPVIMISARDAVAARPAALRAGAGAFLPKPFALSQLLAAITLTGRPGARPGLAGTAAAVTG